MLSDLESLCRNKYRRHKKDPDIYLWLNNYLNNYINGNYFVLTCKYDDLNRFYQPEKHKFWFICEKMYYFFLVGYQSNVQRKLCHNVVCTFSLKQQRISFSMIIIAVANKFTTYISLHVPACVIHS